ncbi:HYDIN protein, partial [Prunella himalayana]|nr:HYDIN protein [Prunella himalayana]
CFVTGEESFHTNLYGEAVDVNVGLSTNSVEVKKTFITMSNHTTVFIENRSNITAHFQWKAFPTEEDENEEKRRLTETDVWPHGVFGAFEWFRPSKPSLALGCVSLGFRSSALSIPVPFILQPREGEIGPNCLAEIKVTFKPLEALVYQCMAYCNISGTAPFPCFSHPQFHMYFLLLQVKLINQGAIVAPFIYIPSTTNVGYCFKFAPKEGIIAPGGTQTIQISFSASVLGTFEEEFQFRVAGSPTPVILTIK